LGQTQGLRGRGIPLRPVRGPRKRQLRQRQQPKRQQGLEQAWASYMMRMATPPGRRGAKSTRPRRFAARDREPAEDEELSRVPSRTNHQNMSKAAWRPQGKWVGQVTTPTPLTPAGACDGCHTGVGLGNSACSAFQRNRTNSSPFRRQIICSTHILKSIFHHANIYNFIGVTSFLLLTTSKCFPD